MMQINLRQGMVMQWQRLLQERKTEAVHLLQGRLDGVHLNSYHTGMSGPVKSVLFEGMNILFLRSLEYLA